MTRPTALLVLLALASLAPLACRPAGPAVTPGIEAPRPPAAPEALAGVVEDYWRYRLRDDVATRLELGLPVAELPDVSEARSRADRDFAAALLSRLAGIDEAALSHQDWLSKRIVEWECRMAVEAHPHFWAFPRLTVHSLPFRWVHDVLQGFPFRSGEDLEAYLSLARQLPRLIDQVRVNAEEQRQRGVLPPAEMLGTVAGLLRSWAGTPEQSPLWVRDERLASVAAGEGGAAVGAFRAELRRLIAGEVAPGYGRLAALLEAARDEAPERVGLGNLPGGEAAYRFLVRYHTTLDLTPEEIHRRGLAEVARVGAAMAEVRGRLGIDEEAPAFHRRLRRDERFLAKTPEEVAERLMAPIRRIEPLIARFFLRTPAAPYGVGRLDPALEGSLTYGYYQVPRPADPQGTYRFNGSRLDERPLIHAAALVYHELVPGHHFQVNLQREDPELPELRRFHIHTAFVEGWAEYASELPLEMGLYDDPWDLYGRYAMDALLSSRLVVDTGMNALGWPRERAIEFLLEHTLESEAQVGSETLRYSVGNPGQALAYKIGARKIWDLRRKAERELGERFDVRRFHEAVIGSGSMPMTVLEEHVEWWIDRERGSG